LANKGLDAFVHNNTTTTTTRKGGGRRESLMGVYFSRRCQYIVQEDHKKRGID
jgi:hypothetical protein